MFISCYLKFQNNTKKKQKTVHIRYHNAKTYFTYALRRFLTFRNKFQLSPHYTVVVAINCQRFNILRIWSVENKLDLGMCRVTACNHYGEFA